MVNIDFDEKTHTYSIDGKRLPSVSALIASDPSLNPWLSKVDQDILKAKAQRGTNIHDYMRRHELGDMSDPYPPYEEFANEWARFRDWLGVNEMQCLAETPMAHTVMGYAGTPDRVYHTGSPAPIVVIDIKTGVESKSHRIQTAAYAYMAASWLGRGAPMLSTSVTRYAVYLISGKPFKAVPHDDPTDFTAFSSLLNLYRWKVNTGLIK